MSEENVIFDLVQGFDIANAEGLYESLSEIKNEMKVQVKGSAVERMDTSSFQLLLAFKLHLEQHDGSLEWLEPSEYLVNSAKLLGLSESLSLPQTVA